MRPAWFKFNIMALTAWLKLKDETHVQNILHMSFFILQGEILIMKCKKGRDSS